MRGTWQTDDHRAAGGGLVVLVIAGAVLFGSAAAAVATAVLVALIVAVVVVVLAVAGTGGYLVYRARHGRALIAPPVVHQLPAPERAAIGPPRELHLHLHGVDPGQLAELAEILRRRER